MAPIDSSSGMDYSTGGMSYTAPPSSSSLSNNNEQDAYI